MRMQRELIARALRTRFNELTDVRLPGLVPGAFGEMAGFVEQIQERLCGASPADLRNSSAVTHAPNGWLASDADCLTALCYLSTGESLELGVASPSPANEFVKALNECRSDPARHFQLLSERYSCPLNFSFAGEDAVRELVLTRLMVQDRASLEKDPQSAAGSDDLLLRLNLAAVHAAQVSDLRFLDSLNYYYDLLYPTWRPGVHNDRLMVSYLALYTRALVAWI